MQTITVERCAIVKNIPLFYFDWIKRLNYFVVFCWNCEEFYKFRLHFFDYDAKSVLFLKGKGIVFEYERLRSTANERKPSTLPIRVVHQRMAQTTEDRAAINDRWRQLSRRIVQQREHEFHSIIEQNAYTIRTRCTRNPLKGFAPFLGLTTLRWPFRGNPPFPLFNPCRVFPPFSRITNFKNGKRDNIFHLLDWKLKITRWRRGEIERIWIFSSIPYRARIVENINKNFRDFFEANGVKSLSRARGAKEKFHFHFPFPRGKSNLHTRKLAAEFFLHRLGAKWRGATNEK